MRQRKIDYTLRESLRAKRVMLKVGVNGLEVVVPRGFGKRKLPGILEANRKWIEKELHRVKESPSPVAPEAINLIAIDECWQVNYQSFPTSDGRFSVKQHTSNRLVVDVDVDDVRNVSSTGIPQIKPTFLGIAPSGIPSNIIPHSKGVKCGLIRSNSPFSYSNHRPAKPKIPKPLVYAQASPLGTSFATP